MFACLFCALKCAVNTFETVHLARWSQEEERGIAGSVFSTVSLRDLSILLAVCVCVQLLCLGGTTYSMPRKIVQEPVGLPCWTTVIP